MEDEGVKNDQNIETEREKIEEKHRTEILILLRSFEFERRDMEARFLEELEKKESELKNLQQNVVDKEGLSSDEVLGFEEQFQVEKNEREVEYEREHSTETAIGTKIHVSTKNQSENRSEIEVIEQGHNTLGEVSNSESNANNVKSLSELERENKKLEMDLNNSRSQILELNGQVKDLTERLCEIETLVENDIPTDKRAILDQMITGIPREISSTHDVIDSCSNDVEAYGKSLEDVFTSNTADQPHRSNSVLSFQLEELNLENEELKRRVLELEQKLRKTVEEHEIRVVVFNEKLDELLGKFISDQSDENDSEAVKRDGYRMNMVEEINNVRLEKTSTELLEEYVSIVLRQKLTAPSPDIFDVNFCHELHSLEKVLDIEVFVGRVFDEEMKDEVKQVLRDKEKELLVAYTLEKLRHEIQHRGTTEMILEELQKEREKDFCVNQAVNEILKVHLGISEDGAKQDGDFDVNVAVNKVLREHLGIKVSDDYSLKGLEKGSVIDDEAPEKKWTFQDIDSLRVEKDDLERNLQELHDCFEKERQGWLEKLEGPLQGASNDPEDKDEIIQRLHAQKVIMEQIFNAERFHLSRLYYMEMKEELELCLKQHQLDRKIETERFVDVWKHHAEVGELYQEILSKETESLQNLQTNIREENVSEYGDVPNDTGRDEFKREHVRLEQLLPLKLELLELQQRRCRDHKAASLILEQAVVALETAAQEQDTLLVRAGYLKRKSSWSSNEDGGGSPDIEKDISSQLNEEELRDNEIASPNNSTEAVGDFSRRDDLVDALVKLFEKLLNEQQRSDGPLIDSCTSDSELSEVDSSSSKDLHSDDEGSIKKENSQNLEDASSTTSSPRLSDTEAKPTEDPEGNDSETLYNTQCVSVPIIFKLPPRIENILNIERFNLSRLLRDEYVDKIRRARQKLRQERAKNEQKNGELVLKFHEEVKALLERVMFGENGVEERVVQQRQKLMATPSYDSGISDFVEPDKKEVVKKYKELLERARRDLNRAHRALRARSLAGDDIKDEMARMKRGAKEARNDLEELEEKQTGLDNERDALLGKIKDAQNSAKKSSTHDQIKISDSSEVSELVRANELPLRSEFDSSNSKQSVTTNKDAAEDSLDENALVPGGENSNGGMEKSRAIDQSKAQFQNLVPNNEDNITGVAHYSLEELAIESEELKKKMDNQMKDMEKKIGKLYEEKTKGEEEVKDLQRKLVAGTGGEEILQEFQEKLKAAREKNISLEENISGLQKEIVIKENIFSDKEKELTEEISELQKKIVAGTGGGEILQKLREKLKEAKEKNIGIEGKNSDLQKEVETMEEIFSNKEENMTEEINELQKKLVAGTGGEEILAELQDKLEKAKEEKAILHTRCTELEDKVTTTENELKDEIKEMEKEIENLQKQVVAGTGGEEILNGLQEKLKLAREENAGLQTKCCKYKNGLERNDQEFRDVIERKNEEIFELQRKLVSGSGGEEILLNLQDKLKDIEQEKCKLDERCLKLEKKLKQKDKDLDNEKEEKAKEVNELQKKLIAGTGGEEVLEELQEKLEETERAKQVLKEKCSKLEEEVKRKEIEKTMEKDKTDVEINKLQKKLLSGTGGEKVLEELREKLKEAEMKTEKLEKTYHELEEIGDQKDEELESKEREVNELQKKIITGTGGEELLEELQEKLKIVKESEKALEKRCDGLENILQEKEKEFVNNNENKQNEIEELQRKLLSGTGSEEVLLDLQEKLNKVGQEKGSLKSRVSELEKDMEKVDTEFEKLLKDKQKEIDKLQRDLVNGTGAEDVLVDLQEKLAKADNETKTLREKCRAQERRKKQKSLDDDDEKKLKRFEAANKVLENENKVKQEKINELQFKMVQGTGEDVLKDLQKDLSEANNRNKDLEIRNAELERERNDLLLSEDGEGNTAALKEENERLEAANGEFVKKLENLQKDLVNGTGSEDLLQELQGEIKELSSENKELRKKGREKDNFGIPPLRGRDRKNLEKDLKAVNLEKERLISDNESKEEEIADLQRKLIAGSGGEKLLENLQQEIKTLKEKNRDLAMHCHNLKEMNKDLMDENEQHRKMEKRLLRVEKENDKLVEEIESKDDEIRELQKSIIDGSGAEELLRALQDKIKETTENNKILQKKCSDLESKIESEEAVGIKDLDLAEAQNEIKRLTRDCEEKGQDIAELQRKLVSGSGGEEVLESLQNQVNNLRKTNSDLDRKLANARRDEIVLESLENKGKVSKGRSIERKAPYNVEPHEDYENITASERGVKFMRKATFRGKNTGNSQIVDAGLDTTFACDQAEATDTPSYEECLQVIPQIQEEKDHWREKYKALRMKVGEQFVDIIPDVWTEEATLEEEREETLLQLSELRQEISKKETPLMKTVSEKERIETELKKVRDKLEICDGNLKCLSDLCEEEKLVEKNEEKLVDCLHQLGLTHDPYTLQEQCSSSGKNREVHAEKMSQDGSDITTLERKVSQLCHEIKELVAEEQSLENGQNFESQENHIASLVNEKTDTEKEIKQIEKAINNLRKCLSTETHTKPNPSYSKPNRKLEGTASDDNEIKTINDLLEKVQQEINLLQSSLETPSVSSGQEINNLLALMKEKSKLEDELTDAEKSLNQLGKRDYEALVKERQTQETVARKLMDLSRDKEVANGELLELDALVKEKEDELLKSFNAELKSKEIPSSKKRRGFRRKKSSLELKSDASSSEEGSFSEVDLGDPPLSSEATLALSEELGSLIQKKSSLDVRLEGLGKEITEQSLKVEKSLLGVKDDPSEEPSLASSFASVEDLTQSQISIFDDYNMIDELSLATSVVKEERVKRKSSRKAPMSKLLKEKSTLEKKLKDLQGRVLVQNGKVKNALREGRNAEKAKEKFVQAVEERKAVENELLNICTKIDDLASEEGPFKEKTGKKGKSPEKKSGKSLSKNDKRRLLSQRECLRQQLENIKKKIENFSLDGDDPGLADFPEMRDVGTIENTVERLRELIAREAELKRDLEKLTTKEDPEMINESLGGELLDSSGELGKYDDKENMTSDSGSLDENISEEGILTEIVKELEDQGKRLPAADEPHQTGDRLGTTQIEDNLNADIDVGKVDTVDMDATNLESFSISSHGPYSKDSKRSSEHNGEILAENPSPYSDVMSLLIKEKAKKEAKLHDLEKAIENEKSCDSETKDVSLVYHRKREDLKNKMAEALKEVKQRKEALDESKKLLRKSFKEDSEDSEELLREDYLALTQQKEELDKHLAAIQDELDKQSETGQGFRDIFAEYQNYKELKNKEEELSKRIENANEKLRKRKEWAAMDQPEEDHTNLTESYADILKRMSEENLNMADLIHELEETKETLSKEREITSELLDLIKSRIGNELLEALMGECLQSPTVETREMGIIGEDRYQELVNKVENDSITVAEIIDDYKKVNQYLYKQNQKLHEKIELLKTKVDEDLLASIVDHVEYGDIDISKKREISKILENNKTLFEQIVSGAGNQNKANEGLALDIESLKMEMEGNTKETDEEEVMEGDLKEKVNSISEELDAAQKRRKELERELQNLEEYREKDKEDHAFSTTKSGVSSETFYEPENRLNLLIERDEFVQREQDKVLEEIKSKLQEAKDLGGKFDDELQKLNEKLADSETDTPEVSHQIHETLKQSEEFEDGLREEHSIEGEASRISEDDRGYREESMGFKHDDEGLKEKILSVQNLQETYVACLDEVQELQEVLKRNLDEEDLDSIVKEMAVKEKSFARNKDEVQMKIPIEFKGMSKKNKTLNNKGILEDVEGLKTEKKSLEEMQGVQEKENNDLLEQVVDLQNENEEITATSNEVDQSIKGITKDVDDLETENKSLDEMLGLQKNKKNELLEKISDLQNENEEVTGKLNEASERNREFAKNVEDLEREKKSTEDMVGLQKKENNNSQEESCNLQNKTDKLLEKLNEADERTKEYFEDLNNYEKNNKSLDERASILDEENKDLNDKIRDLKIENEKIIIKLNEANEALKQNKENQKALRDLQKENESLKEMSDLLEQENNEIIPKMEELQKLRKDLEDEVEYLRKEEKDFESLKEQLKEAEGDRENIEEELEYLKRGKKEVEDFVHGVLNQDIDHGVKSALEKYNENYEKTEQENIIFKEEVEKFGKLRSIVGDNLSKKLLELSNEGVVVSDTENDSKSVDKLVKDKNTLARILKEFEDDLENMKQHLGEELFLIITGKDPGFDDKESEDALKMVNELKNGKHIKDIVKEYEDLINSQVSELENVEYLQQKINMLEKELEELKKQRNKVFVEDKVSNEGKTSDRDDLTYQSESGVEKRGERDFGPEWGDRENSVESVQSSKIAMLEAFEADDQNFKSNKDDQNDGIENEYQDLLKKVIEHQNEIEEAEEMLRKQKEKHEAEKQNMVEQFNEEKTNMQQLINNERSSMEKAMQNLINEIVRLKEERNEIRKSYRLEKEKFVLAFENERTELLSKNEVVRNEIEEKLEKKFQDDLEKAKKEMASREAELKEELIKLKNEKNALVSKVEEMEEKIGSEVIVNEDVERSSTFKEIESRQQIENEFEEKMKVEKKRFQETLNSLRQEIERLQKEKSKAINGISKKQERGSNETANFSANEALIYERLESEFRAKTNSEKMFMEGRIKELRKENEALTQQRQELKSSTRMERLEMSRKHEREKEELAEKYRNELKTLKKNVEKKQASQESSTLPTQNFLELRKRIRERDAKIKRYEMFFKELNEEASMLQRDPDMAV